VGKYHTRIEAPATSVLGAQIKKPLIPGLFSYWYYC
jgi:hypothetical protein